MVCIKYYFALTLIEKKSSAIHEVDQIVDKAFQSMNGQHFTRFRVEQIKTSHSHTNHKRNCAAYLVKRINWCLCDKTLN